MRKSEDIKLEFLQNSKPLEPIIKTKLSRPIEDDQMMTMYYPPLPYEVLWEYSTANAYHGRCIQIKARTAVNYGFDGSKRSLDYLQDLAGEVPLSELLHNTIVDYQLWGNAFWEAERDIKGLIREIYHVPGWTCYICQNYAFIQDTGLKQTRFAPFGSNFPSQMLHFKSYYPMSSYYGAPEWYVALESLRLDKKMKIYLSSYFDNNALPDILIMLTGGKFAEKAEEKIRNALRNNKGPHNSHKSLVLSNSSDTAKLAVHNLTPTLEEFALDVPYNHTREEIIAAHGVPPRLVGIVSSGQLGGGGEADSQMDMFVEFTETPIMTYFEGMINRNILDPAGLPADFKFMRPAWYNAEGKSGSNTVSMSKSGIKSEWSKTKGPKDRTKAYQMLAEWISDYELRNLKPEQAIMEFIEAVL